MSASIKADSKSARRQIQAVNVALKACRIDDLKGPVYTLLH